MTFKNYLDTCLSKGTVGFIYIGDIFKDSLYLNDDGGSYSFNFTEYAMDNYEMVSENLTFVLFLAGNSKHLASKLHSNYNVNITIGEDGSAPLVCIYHFAKDFINRISNSMGYITFKDAINSAYNSAKQSIGLIFLGIIGIEVVLFIISSSLSWLLLKLQNIDISIGEVVIVAGVILELWGIISMYLSKYNPVKYN